MPREVYPGMPRLSNERLHVLKTCKPNSAGPFADLTWEQQQVAQKWLWKFTQRWGNDLPPWRYGILVGVAKRLAKNPPSKGWGFRLHCHRGARALADRCRAQGIVHPRIAAMHAARGLNPVQ